MLWIILGVLLVAAVGYLVYKNKSVVATDVSDVKVEIKDAISNVTEDVKKDL